LSVCTYGQTEIFNVFMARFIFLFALILRLERSPIGDIFYKTAFAACRFDSYTAGQILENTALNSQVADAAAGFDAGFKLYRG